MPLTTLQMIIGILIAVGISAAARAQTVYRWLDHEGGVHYSDLPPPANARDGEQKSLDNNVIDSSELPFSVRTAADNFPVTLYSSATCGDLCDVGRSLLKRRGIPFAEKLVETKDDADALSKVLGNPDLMVPSLTVGRQSAKGYLEAEWNALLDAAGYPKPTR
jgi:hypothetical protein